MATFTARMNASPDRVVSRDGNSALEQGSSAVERQLHTRRGVAIVDPHPVMREGVRFIVDRIGGLEVIASTGLALEAERAVRERGLDLLVLSLELSSEDGLEVLQRVRMHANAPPVIALSSRDASRMAELVLQAGGSGFVSKHSPAQYLETAIREVLAGRIFMPSEVSVRPVFASAEPRVAPVIHERQGLGLSTREIEIFDHLGSGRTAREIAEALGLSVKTVASHRANIQAKLGVKTLAELLRAAVLWREQRGGSTSWGDTMVRPRGYSRVFDGEG
jgi:DNA-binding NarL/FixJ family response regulator